MEPPFPPDHTGRHKAACVVSEYLRRVLERRELEGGVVALVSRRLEGAGFLVAFTERTGGVSRGRFRSLNLGMATGDLPERVVANRRRAAVALGLPSFASAQQVHGSGVVRVGPGRAGAGFEDADTTLPEADVLATRSRGVAMAVLAADCVPLALADITTGTLAVVHAGWRGVAAGVVGRALGMFRPGPSLRAVIGPAVGPEHYEVGEDVALAVSAALPGGAITRRVSGRLLLDLPGSVARALKEAGVRSVEREEACTACHPDRFFSYRRDGSGGRQALIAVRR